VAGSIAHGDALTPLTDVDLGIVVPDSDKVYGPERKGPQELKTRAANAIRVGLKNEYSDLAVEVKGRKRLILISIARSGSKRTTGFHG
jgi:predicted nucleotidyltransferase